MFLGLIHLLTVTIPVEKQSAKYNVLNYTKEKDFLRTYVPLIFRILPGLLK